MAEEKANKQENNQALHELACTRGWRDIIGPMLKRDMNFMATLVLGPPDRDDATKELVFKIKDMSSYRFAHGQSCEAKKISDKVENACKALNKQKQ